jgi:hypothetical protein
VIDVFTLTRGQTGAAWQRFHGDFEAGPGEKNFRPRSRCDGPDSVPNRLTNGFSAAIRAAKEALSRDGLVRISCYRRGFTFREYCEGNTRGAKDNDSIVMVTSAGHHTAARTAYQPGVADAVLNTE